MTYFALQLTTHPLYHTKAQYLYCQIHFRHDNTVPVSDIAPTLSMSSDRLHWHLTHFCMTSYPPSLWHHMNYIQHHTQSSCHHTTVLMTSQTLYMKPHPVWGQHIHLTCDFRATICVLTPTVKATSHALFLWHHTHHMFGIVCIIQDITSSLLDLKPPFWGHHTHYIRNAVHCICFTTPTL